MLVETSLLQRETAAKGASRYRMLEVVREFAAEQLEASGERPALRQTHASYCLDLAEQHELSELMPDGEHGVAVLEAELGNLRAALVWLDAAGESESLLRLAAALGRLWYGQGHYREGGAWLERALAVGGDEPGRARARASIMCGMIALIQGANQDAEDRLAAGLALSRSLGDVFLAARALIGLGGHAMQQGDHDRATRFLEEAAAETEGIADQRLAAIVAGRAFDMLGLVARMRGDFALAAARHDEALRRDRAAGYAVGVIIDLGDLGDVARDQGDYPRAIGHYREALSLVRESTGTRSVTEDLEGVAVVAAAVGQPVRAARLFGVVEALRERIGLSLRFPADQVAHERGVAAARAGLGEAAFAAAWAAGRELSRDQAIAEALEPLEPNDDVHPSSLTKRELDVLRLLVAGHTDREIAAALFISRRTAEGHVARLCEKLGARTRSAAVAAALAGGLVDPPSPLRSTSPDTPDGRP